MPLRKEESASQGNTDGDENDGDDNSNNSTISEFLRRIVPTDKWSIFFSTEESASNLLDRAGFGPDKDEQQQHLQQQEQQQQDEASDDFPFDVVPFNGDTDHCEFFENNRLPSNNNGNNDNVGSDKHCPIDFSNIDIHVPADFKSFGSNISPIGNVSSKVVSASSTSNDNNNNGGGCFNINNIDWFDDSNNHPDDESDDDLDRILGTRVEQQQQQQHPQQEGNLDHNHQPIKNDFGGTAPTKEAEQILNRTISTGGESGSSLGESFDDEDPCIDKGSLLPLVGCVFERRGNHDDLSVILVEAALEANNDSNSNSNSNSIKAREEKIQRETILKHIQQQRAASAALAWPKERSTQIRKRSLLLSKKKKPMSKVFNRSVHFWLVALCIFLTLVLAIMLITMFPLPGKNNQNNNNDSNYANTPNNLDASNNEADPPKTPEATMSLPPAETPPSPPPASSPLLPNQELPTEHPKLATTTASPTLRPVVSTTTTPMPTRTPRTGSPSFLRPSRIDNTTEASAPAPAAPARSPSSSLWADNITEASAAPTRIPSSVVPTPKPFTWSEDDPNGDGFNSDYQFGYEINNGEQESSRLPQVHLNMGPMVGHTTHDSVILWAYYTPPTNHRFGSGEENPGDSFLEILLYDSDGWVKTIEEAKPDPKKNNAVFATISGLEQLRVYRYEMRLYNKVVGSGSFRTAPLEAEDSRSQGGTNFEYVLASCMDRSEHPVQRAWEAILTTTPSSGTREDNYPDFAILAGDTIYLKEGVDVDDFNGVDFDRYWYRNHQQRTEPHFAHFAGNTPIYAVWNNHDYGSEVATRYQAGKEESLRAWKSLWPNPGSNESNNNNANGIYYSFYWGDVHYIVTDDHWNRDPSKESRWGLAQTEWIRSELVSSRGTFKVIVLGSDIMQRGWSSDLENIGATVTEHSINGVLFHAGDIHRNEFKRLQIGGFPYPVTQITSSGIAKVWRKPFAKIRVDTRIEDPVMETFFFGAATNSEENTEWINDPKLVCSEIGSTDRTKEHSCSETIRLSDLSVIA